jgi:hypothetical protein
MEIIKALYDTARKDLLAAETLYWDKKYSQSMFFFQQGVEKANKVLGLLEKIIQPQELSEIGHNSMKMYKKSLLMRKATIDETIAYARNFPKIKKHQYYKDARNHSEDLKKGEKFLQDLNKDNFAKLSYGDLYYCLDNMWDLYHGKLQIPTNLDDVLDQQFQPYLTLKEAIGTEEALKEKAEFEAALKDIEQRGQIEKGVRMVSERLIDFGYINCTLYFCAIITLSHAIKARYPDPASSFHPLAFYTRRLPLVELQPEFVWYMKKALKKMSLIYPELKNNRIC